MAEPIEKVSIVISKGSVEGVYPGLIIVGLMAMPYDGHWSDLGGWEGSVRRSSRSTVGRADPGQRRSSTSPGATVITPSSSSIGPGRVARTRAFSWSTGTRSRQGLRAQAR